MNSLLPAQTVIEKSQYRLPLIEGPPIIRHWAAIGLLACITVVSGIMMFRQGVSGQELALSEYNSVWGMLKLTWLAIQERSFAGLAMSFLTVPIALFWGLLLTFMIFPLSAALGVFVMLLGSSILDVRAQEGWRARLEERFGDVPDLPLFACDHDGAYLYSEKGQYLFYPWESISKIQSRKLRGQLHALGVEVKVADSGLRQKLKSVYPVPEKYSQANAGFVRLEIPFREFFRPDINKIYKLRTDANPRA